MDYCDVFISCLNSRSDGTHPLVSKWCMLNFSKSVLIKKQTHLHSEWPEREWIVSIIIEWAFPLKMVTFCHIWYKHLWEMYPLPAAICLCINRTVREDQREERAVERIQLWWAIPPIPSPPPLCLSTCNAKERGQPSFERYFHDII